VHNLLLKGAALTQWSGCRTVTHQTWEWVLLSPTSHWHRWEGHVVKILSMHRKPHSISQRVQNFTSRQCTTLNSLTCTLCLWIL